MKKLISFLNVKWRRTNKKTLEDNVILIACIVENFINASINELDINLLYPTSLLGYTRQCGLKYTDKGLQTLQDKDFVLFLENKIRGISSVLGDRYLESDEKKHT